MLITLVGAAVRVMNVLWWRPTTDRPGYHGFKLAGDTFYYHWQANALAHGDWFVDPYRWKYLGENVASAGHPPLYTIYLGALVDGSGSTPSPAIGWRRLSSAWRPSR